MDFQFTEEQDMLRNFARSFMEDKITKEHVREMENDELGFSEDLWKEMAEMGWMGLVFPEEYGGQGMGFFELAVLLEEMGRACCPGPFFSTVLCGMSIMDAGSEDQKKEYLPKIGDGSLKMALALLEPAGTLSPEGISAQATAEGDDYVLNGTKLFVSDANAADYLLVAAKTGNGITMFVADAKSAGINTTMLTTIASDKQAEVVLENVKVPKANVLGEVDKGWDVAQKIIQRGAIGKCAEIIGGAQFVLDMTIEYSKERVQFGKPIGSFQAVQHHGANMATDVDGSKFITYEAAWLMGEGEPCAKEISMAKAWCSDAYQRILTTAHQVHGAIGFTMDHDLQLYFRRGKAAELAFGDADYHREMVACEMGV
ncbi:MAG: acyl-CoA/acyl-ACP dehydrogenase [Chloroflexi bacterium]|nr:acyl-CoA/acyl-ACP dehydrogenase [Chloroflexota bacterium]